MASRMAEPDGADTGAVRIDRDASAFIVAIEGKIETLLGWTADDLIGRPSTDFIHPQDQPTAISAWMSMIDEPGRPFRWRGRYQSRDGEWVWVETVNTNRLDDPDYGCVLTLMHCVERGDLSVEEQLRAREQLLNRLADALPVGLVHFDAAGGIIATNDRLDAIVGRAGSATVEDLFSSVVEDDRAVLAAAIASILEDQEAVDGVELRLTRPSGPGVVCSVSMRHLTDGDGVVTGAIATVDDVTDQARMRRQLEHRATTDALTSCLNREAILDALRGMVHRIGRAGTGVAVVFVDLDGFKQINDTFGHATGDEVLTTVASRLRGVVRGIDQVGRLGGDEFLVVCPDVEGTDAAALVGRRLAVAASVELGDRDVPVPIRASVGVAYTDSDDVEADDLVARADAAMYQSKQERSAEPVLTVVRA